MESKDWRRCDTDPPKIRYDDKGAPYYSKTVLLFDADSGYITTGFLVTLGEEDEARAEPPSYRQWGRDGYDVSATHWMPLPDPPKEPSHAQPLRRSYLRLAQEGLRRRKEMRTIRVYTYKEKQPKVGEFVYLLIPGRSTGRLEIMGSGLAEYYPQERFPGEPQEGPLLGWHPTPRTAANKPVDTDLWIPAGDLYAIFNFKEE